MLQKTKGQGGITLVALVVTIVVLLILAGISIALVFSQDGVIGRAQQAQRDTGFGTIQDNLGDILGAYRTDAMVDNKDKVITVDMLNGDPDASPTPIEGDLEGTGITVTATNDTFATAHADGTVTMGEGAQATLNDRTFNISFSSGLVQGSEVTE